MLMISIISLLKIRWYQQLMLLKSIITDVGNKIIINIKN